MGELRLRVLGSFEVEGVESYRLGARKARTLLKVLALARGRPVPVDRLVEWLWPTGPPARPAVQVAVLVSRLRSVLGSDRLVRSDAGYALLADWLDLDALATLAEEASRRLASGSWGAARVAAAGALMLDRGPLLADEPDAPWAEVDRAAAARLVAQARHTAALGALAAGDPSAAAQLAEGLLDHDPYDEAALRTLMAAHAAAGRPASALAAYARVRARLGEDLGVDPAPATEVVHTAILREEPIPGIVIGDASPPAGTAVVGGQETALPGRRTELDALDAALAATARGALSVVSVEGEAGIGKTRLLSVWSARARARGATVLAGRCDELDRTLPLEAILDALGRHLRAVGPEPAAGILGSDAPMLAPLLRHPGGEGAVSAPGGARPAKPVSALADPTTGQALLFDALLGVLTRVAGDGPVVLLLDDAHLAGAFTMDWLRFAAHRAPHLPLLVVAALRPEEGAPLPATVTISLGPLDLAAAEAVVGPERGGELFTRSGGHPLFLVELAAADPTDVLPASIREAVAERCDRAGPAVAATLRTAAVLGPVADLDLLAAVLRLPPVELLDHLEEGGRRRLLVESEAGFEFGHVLVREALAAGVGASRRALIHREAARALAERPRAEPLLVAYHARRGGDRERAAVALTEAARLAAGRSDHADAERRLDQALALADLPEIRLERARVRILRQDFAGAAEDAGVALAHGGGAPALEVSGWAAYYQRDFPLARRLADDGARLAEDPLLRASCLSLAGYVCTTDGDLEGAETRLEEATRLAQGPTLVVAAGVKGTLRVYQGRVEEGLDLLHPVTLPGAPGPGFLGLRGRATLGYGLALMGRVVEALAVFDDLEAEMVRRGTERYRGFATNSRGWILRNLGAETAADEANCEALEAAERFAASNPRMSAEWRVHGLLDLASGCLQAGDLDGARGRLTEVEPLYRVEHAMHWRHQLRSRLLTGRLALAEGDLEEAQALAAGLAEEATRLGVQRYLVPARLLDAQARALVGEAIDRDEVGCLLGALPRVAGLEAWWLTAQVAAATGVDAWWVTAEQRVAGLADQAGRHAAGLRRYAAARLEGMRSSGLRP